MLKMATLRCTHKTQVAFSGKIYTCMQNTQAVSIKNLVKDYGAGDNVTRAVNSVSLDISPGEFLMITGRNGSGKSTLMHIMALLDEPTKGEIFINGKDLSHVKASAKSKLRLRELGYIFQEYALIAELTALENVMLPAMMLAGRKAARQKAQELLKKVNLEKKQKRLPTQLSGGEQQRVAVARSLINDPKIIFADEPTANLDSIASVEVLEIFKKLNRDEGITIVMVTHEPEELAYASRVINLSDGKLNEK